MDAKYIASKTVFFLLIVGSVTLFSTVFGQQNSLVGVTILIAALMMLSVDMTAKPVWYLGLVLFLNLSLGVGAYLSLAFNPYVGFLINFLVVFYVTFLTMQDLKSPYYFPYVLGYAFIVATPVTGPVFTDRILGLIVGSIAIVALNLIVNKTRYNMTCHAGIEGTLAEVRSLAEKKLNGEPIELDDLRNKCSVINGAMTNRLRDMYKMTPSERAVVNLATSIEELGRTLYRSNIDKKDIEDLIALIDVFIAHEGGTMTAAQTHEKVEKFISEHRDVGRHVVSSIRVIDYEFTSMDNGSIKDAESEIPVSFRMKTLLSENINRNSVSFTFAFRMALLFAIAGFIGDYFAQPHAKWMMFTAAAVVLPYIEGSVKKSFQRAAGTIGGVGVFYAIAAVITVAGLTGDARIAAITILLMGISYATELKKPQNYAWSMFFTTIIALLSAWMLDPAEEIMLDRLLFIGLGIFMAIVFNHIVFPYSIKDEIYDMTRKSMAISRNHILDLYNHADGKADPFRTHVLTVKADSVAAKLKNLISKQPVDEVEEFMIRQSEISSRCTYLKTLTGMDLDGSARKAVLDVLNEYSKEEEERDLSFMKDLNDEDEMVANDTIEVLELYRRSRNAYDRINMLSF